MVSKSDNLAKWWADSIKADQVSERALKVIDALQMSGLHERMIAFDELKKFAEDRGIVVRFKTLPTAFKSGLFYYKGKPFILINSACSRESQWYLLGFELGHNILHVQNNINLPCFSEPNYLNNTSSNAEADYFVQSTFLPRRLLGEWAKETKGDGKRVLQKMINYVEHEIGSRTDGLGERPLSLVKVRMINRLKIYSHYYATTKMHNIPSKAEA
jgi:Zn-dependent peptidase ImmA (M78 family)